MTSLRRKKSLATCQGKQLFLDETSAVAAATALRRSKGVNARAYRCNGKRGQQKHWHITSGRW
jgi:hypothetical protein